MAQWIKNLPAVQETWVQSLGWEDLLEEEMETHSSIHAWKIPLTERSLVGCSPKGHRLGHDWATKHTHTHHKKIFFNLTLNSLSILTLFHTTSGCHTADATYPAQSWAAKCPPNTSLSFVFTEASTSELSSETHIISRKEAKGILSWKNSAPGQKLWG